MKKAVTFLFILFWIIMAFSPHDRIVWLAENIIFLFAFPLVIYLDKKYRFSNTTFLMLFIFGIFHIIGSYFTYNDVPFFTFEIFGEKRNYYDRFVHFLFGLLVYPAFFEIYYHQKFTKKTSFLIAFLFIMTISSFYEIAEWLLIEITHSNGQGSYLITQGDEWDSQKDMICAATGALLSYLVVSAVLQNNTSETNRFS
ncbi:DUF2238 domain-containing protein [Nitrosophilus alvini]|uniref:DUF2238 domain-containing protein n=1 Tax=Nitrosophilus alvini TaxID=2714855 RepID=UPI001909A856|nr:DUF2238 domain-containing protein [Nitrosophilus alvini]